MAIRNYLTYSGRPYICVTASKEFILKAVEPALQQ